MGKVFKSLTKVSKETKLEEFQFKLIHRIVATKIELFKYGIKADDECCFCGDKDSIDRTFIDCPFTETFIQKVIHWFNTTNKSQISSTIEEMLFGISGNSYDNSITRKLNYTIFYYTSKLNNKAISLPEFVDEVKKRYSFENICNS